MLCRAVTRPLCFQGCPKSIRKRIGATEFGDTFLPTIPVLQWARHAQEDEYQRLRRYGGAHGWKDVRWDGVCGWGHSGSLCPWHRKGGMVENSTIPWRGRREC